jgi:hypothetical protein
MNGFTENTANAADRPPRRETAMSLITARRMLPLVQRIVADVVGDQQALRRLQPEQEVLDAQRRSLPWPQRQRRYHLREEIASLERHLHAALVELEALGVALLDGDIGRVGFPTIVNDRRAYFSWLPGEEDLRSWHFVDETTCRPIPPSWQKVGDATLTGKG